VNVLRSCETCRYFDVDDDDVPKGQGTCRRYAPRPVIYPATRDGELPLPSWPAVLVSDWCGEYKIAGWVPRRL
jgi:hypothetical protein